ncbi:MAG: heme biosynthesis protein HemY [Burkholderiales bacterium]|nr:heme biosynthesis protein HemY [Burkholderiales bacterium]
MRGLVWVVALFALALGLALVGRYNDGYVLLFVPPQRIELSLTLAVLLLALAFLALHLAIRTVAYTLRLPDMVREFRRRQQKERARRALFDALIGWFEGRYARAERAARIAFATGEEPGLAALVGAQAAQRIGNREQRDLWIERARSAAEGADSAALRHAYLLVHAEFLAEDGDDGAALAALAELNRGGARHVAAQRLSLKLVTRAGLWEEALRSAHQLEEHKAIHPTLAARTREVAYAGVFDAADDPAGRARRVPVRDRTDPRTAVVIAAALVKRDLLDEARVLLEGILERGWDDAAGLLYARCAADPQVTRRMLERAEAWCRRDPAAAAPLLTLGRLCARLGLWGKARESLEECARRAPGPAASLELARVLEAGGDAMAAAPHYRAAALAWGESADRGDEGASTGTPSPPAYRGETGPAVA